MDTQEAITQAVCEYLINEYPELYFKIIPNFHEEPDDRCDAAHIFSTERPGWRLNVHFWGDGVDVSDDQDDEWDGTTILPYSDPDFLDLILRAVHERLYDLPRRILHAQDHHH